MKQNAGEQVFSGNIDDVLAGKIVSNARRNAGDQESEAGNRKAAGREGGGRFVLMLIVVMLLMMAGYAFLMQPRKK
ncbi:MAG: hypothetical protein GF398_08615 [Chitinivibrionales bacterium]|nr:hypothetical protein [Chitinivibrionales bacterium]